MAEWTEDGKMIPDDTPVEVPLQYQQGESESMRIARAVSLEMSKMNEKQGRETYAEAMDFDIEDEEDIFPMSECEVREMQEEFLDEPEVKTEVDEPTEDTEDGETEKTEKNEREEDSTR